jgi:hypothetical protein
MPPVELKIRDVTPTITTFSTPFNRFAPFGYRRFVAVGNRATAIRLHDNRIILLNPIQLEDAVRDKLNQLGGVHLIASDLGHHMYVKDYVDAWPEAKTIGVPGLDSKGKDVNWNCIYKDWRTSPEDQFDFAQDFETVLFEGFITYCVAWYHQPTKTLIQSDLMINLSCTEVCLRGYPPQCTGTDLKPAIPSQLVRSRSTIARVCKARTPSINMGEAPRIPYCDR